VEKLKYVEDGAAALCCCVCVCSARESSSELRERKIETSTGADCVCAFGTSRSRVFIGRPYLAIGRSILRERSVPTASENRNRALAVSVFGKFARARM
jgi:hypothetical protein